MTSLRKSLEEKYDEDKSANGISAEKFASLQMASQSRSLQINIAHQMASPGTLQREV